ncbi:unnamed protein product [Rhizophagus irregularis]|uniref:SWIM-type domain-containing protein n=1 Tax=Rhizophagus irregularis TaxID=588596 RepID=A0A915YV38_9GLOM|nr:unnamed protein product [Rhizophagus irregularis]
MNQQQENPTFHVDARFEGHDNHLVGLCWMSPNQQELWARFHDVILLDTTAKTNRFSMILCVVILVDNHNRSRLAATAIVSDETKDTFSWLFASISKATGGLAPSLLYTDADPAMIAAARSSWPATKHHFCLFHIRKNLEKHFLSKYHGEKWKKFFATFCSTQLERTIERLLEKESRYVRLNETIGKLPVSQEEDYYNHYFKEVDVLCQQFLTPAVLKLQRHEMNRSMHYRCHIANLENELQKQETAESPTGMFSEDMFDACVIELAQLIADLDLTRINELWRVSSINKKSKHFIVLYDNTMHLCTCLTLISHGLVCRHFFAVMLVSSISKFHIGLIPRRWYTNAKVMEMDLIFSHTPAISVISDNEFGMVEYMVEVDLSHLENIRGHHVFTKEICQEMTRKQQWGKTFGIMKKTLDLAIETGRIEELYELHENLAKELESEMVQIVQGDHNTEFAQTISNPVRIITKGQKPKNMSGNKGKRKQIHESTNNKENNIAEELSHKKLRKALNTVDEELNVNVDGESSKSKSRRCGTCNQIGHNMRTCPNEKN